MKSEEKVSFRHGVGI